MSRTLTLTQAATSIFIGIPMTIGLVAALSVYCSFQLVAALVLPRPARPKPHLPIEEAFSSSLENLSRIHAEAIQPTVTETKDQLTTSKSK